MNPWRKSLYFCGFLLLFTFLCLQSDWLFRQLSLEQSQQQFQKVKLQRTRRFKLHHCDCFRELPVTPDGTSKHQYTSTTCNRDAFQRGSGQKVVAFAFYGDNNSVMQKAKGYFRGIQSNLESMKQFYPGWVMRLYFDLDRTSPLFRQLCDLACDDASLDICDAADLPGSPFTDARDVFPMIWRLFPTVDPQVDLFVSRDLDSLFSERELSAVREWLQSPKKVHVMRDHPYHGTSMLGGMWGSKLNSTIRNKFMWSWTAANRDPDFRAGRSTKGSDQIILSKFVWPWAQEMTMSHDSYLCQSYPSTQPFPSQRLMEPNNFVGSVIAENATLNVICPEGCRPLDHKDWTFC